MAKPGSCTRKLTKKPRFGLQHERAEGTGKGLKEDLWEALGLYCINLKRIARYSPPKKTPTNSKCSVLKTPHYFLPEKMLVPGAPYGIMALVSFG